MHLLRSKRSKVFSAEDDIDWQIAEYIADSFEQLVACIILLWITYQILINLHKCCCCPYRHHNWLIIPSKQNRFYAILSSIALALSNWFYFILYIVVILNGYLGLSTTTFYEIEILPAVLGHIGHSLYFLYMISTLKYHMESEEFIATMIPKKAILITQFLVLFNFILCILDEAIWFASYFSFEFYGIDYLLISNCSVLFLRVFLEITLLILYSNGLNNVAHFWYSKAWKEYEQYGETERTHEIMIVITRSSIVVIASLVASVLFITWRIIEDYVLFSVSFQAFVIGDFLTTSFDIIDDVTYGISIYFIYPFGSSNYRRCCNKCHNVMYKKCESRHQNQVNNGGFDGVRYIPNKQNGCCCKITRNQEYLIN